MYAFVVRLCAALLCLGLSVRPALAVPDIADFSLGMSREDILLRAVSPCGGRLCGQVSFGGRIWDASFRVRGDALDAISLFGPPRDEYVEAAFSAFSDSPYVVYRAVSDNAVFDFPSLAAGGLGPEALDAAFDDFVRALISAGGSFVSFFYTEPAVYAALKQEARKALRPDAAAAPEKAAGHAPKAATPEKISPPDAATDSAPDAVPDTDIPDAGGKRPVPPAPGQTPAARPAPAGDADRDEAAPAEPEPRSDGVVCAMTVAGNGIVILIMTRADLEAEMAARAARL